MDTSFAKKCFWDYTTCEGTNLYVILSVLNRVVPPLLSLSHVSSFVVEIKPVDTCDKFTCSEPLIYSVSEF